MSNKPHRFSVRWCAWWVVALLWVVACGVALARCAHAQERSYGRECLALVGYSEARSDGFIAMQAVEQVVLTRLSLHRYGETICDVAFQKGQFEGITLWPVPRIPREPLQWYFAMLAANALIADWNFVPRACNGAVFFSQTKPAHPLCKVGKHWFSI